MLGLRVGLPISESASVHLALEVLYSINCGFAQRSYCVESWCWGTLLLNACSPPCAGGVGATGCTWGVGEVGSLKGVWPPGPRGGRGGGPLKNEGVGCCYWLLYSSQVS